jgi:hypothetical protein
MAAIHVSTEVECNGDVVLYGGATGGRTRPAEAASTNPHFRTACRLLLQTLQCTTELKTRTPFQTSRLGRGRTTCRPDTYLKWGGQLVHQLELLISVICSVDQSGRKKKSTKLLIRAVMLATTQFFRMGLNFRQFVVVLVLV